MDFVDRDVKCSDCGGCLCFRRGKIFFKAKGFKNDPKHCKSCKDNRDKEIRRRVETQIKCSECGLATTFPFKPTQDRQVLCRALLRSPYNGKERRALRND